MRAEEGGMERDKCYGCEERWVGGGTSCHASCPHYLERRKKLDGEAEARNRIRAAELDADAFKLEAIRRTTRHIRRRGERE